MKPLIQPVMAPAKKHAYEDRPANCIGMTEGLHGPQKLPAMYFFYDDACCIVVMRFEP